MELHPQEANLILFIRNKFQWGEIVIEARNGLPKRMMKAYDWTQVPDEYFGDGLGKEN
jgi:hypothetical protein